MYVCVCVYVCMYIYVMYYMFVSRYVEETIFTIREKIHAFIFLSLMKCFTYICMQTYKHTHTHIRIHTYMAGGPTLAITTMQNGVTEVLDDNREKNPYRRENQELQVHSYKITTTYTYMDTNI